MIASVTGEYVRPGLVRCGYYVWPGRRQVMSLPPRDRPVLASDQTGRQGAARCPAQAGWPPRMTASPGLTAGATPRGFGWITPPAGLSKPDARSRTAND